MYLIYSFWNSFSIPSLLFNVANGTRYETNLREFKETENQGDDVFNKTFPETPSLYQYNEGASGNVFYKNVILFSLSHTSHFHPHGWCQQLRCNKGSKYVTFLYYKGPLTHRRGWGKVQLVQAVPWLALPERMSPACSQAEKHTQMSIKGGT